MAKFLEFIEGQSRGHWTLAPEETVQHFSTDAWKLLNPGDHVVVMIGGRRRVYAHHGIVISPYGPGQDPQVAHFVSRTGDMLMRDARLQIGSHTEFIGARATFGIVPYASANSESDKFEHQRTVDLAKLMVESPQLALKKYNLIAWNCECFAWVCKTGDIYAHSHQVARVLKAISDDLRKGESDARKVVRFVTISQRRRVVEVQPGNVMLLVFPISNKPFDLYLKAYRGPRVVIIADDTCDPGPGRVVEGFRVVYSELVPTEFGRATMTVYDRMPEMAD
eukprot:gene13468-biopygen22585